MVYMLQSLKNYSLKYILITLFLLFGAIKQADAAYIIKHTNTGLMSNNCQNAPADSPGVLRQFGLFKKLDKAYEDKAKTLKDEKAERDAKKIRDPKRIRKERSGIFGRLSLYMGLISIAAFILTLCFLANPVVGNIAGVWVLSSILAVPLGWIGMVHRRKKRMALAGLLIGLMQIVIFYATISLAVSLYTAAQSAFPILAFIMLAGRG